MVSKQERLSMKMVGSQSLCDLFFIHMNMYELSALEIFPRVKQRKPVLTSSPRFKLSLAK